MVNVLPFRFQQFFVLFTLLPSKSLLKRDFLDIYLTTFFALLQFENTSAMRVTFFLKMFRIESKFRKFKKKRKKKRDRIFNSEIIGSENVAINCLC